MAAEICETVIAICVLSHFEVMEKKTTYGSVDTHIEM